MKNRYFFAESSLRGNAEFQALQHRVGEIQWIEDFREFRLDTMHREKQCVIYAKKRGPWLKPFYCYWHNAEYRYFSMDLAEGCAFDCVYCYLQSHLDNGAMTVFIGPDEAEAALAAAGSGMWISTGLLTDSLLAEELNPMLPRLSHAVPPGSYLEMRTKSANVECLLNPAILRDRVILSWSVNPQSIARTFEYGASPVPARLQAARRAIESGYRVAFHFDPVFFFEGWQSEYAALIDELRHLPNERIAFLSLGIFRYMPDLGAQIRKRFPYHSILTGEFFRDEDGKYHYLRAIRREIHAAFHEWLRPWMDRIPIFWSMEPEWAYVTRNQETRVTSL